MTTQTTYPVVIITAYASSHEETARLAAVSTLDAAMAAAREAGYRVIDNMCETNDTWSAEREDASGEMTRPIEHLVVVEA